MKKDLEKRVNSGILNIKPYEPGKSVFEASKETETYDILKMASNENPLGMCPAASKALHENLEKAFAYPEVSCTELRKALARYHNVKPDNIIVGNGGDGVIYAIAMALIDQDDEVIIPEITFSYYEIVSRAMRSKIIFSTMKGYDIDLDDIITKISNKTKMIWLSNPNNPTGCLINKNNFARFLHLIPPEVFLIYDGVYADFADLNKLPDTINLIKKGKKNIFLIKSFSKIYGLAGVRIGYGIGSQELINLIYRVRPPFDVSVLAQEAALASLKDREFYNRTLKLNEKEKLYLYKELTARGFKYIPTHTNFILIDTERDCRQVQADLLEQGIIVRPAASFNMPTFIRITIGTHEQNQRFIRALDKVLPRC